MKIVQRSRKAEEKRLDTTVTIEFFTESEQHLKTLEQQLKHIHDVEIYLIEPRDANAPALVAIGIYKSGERAKMAVHNVAQGLYDFIHEDTGAPGQKQILLLTIEGERVDIEPLPIEEIERIINAAKEGESA
jgi:hypothetical protein